MGGVDHNDQLRGYYNIEIKSRKYYKYVFYAAFDVAITNSLIMSKFIPSLKKKDLKEFRVTLANELIGTYNSRKRRGRLRKTNQLEVSVHYIFRQKLKKEGIDVIIVLNTFCHTGKEDDCFLVYHSQYGSIDD